jgi:hypothetical protein
LSTKFLRKRFVQQNVKSLGFCCLLTTISTPRFTRLKSSFVRGQKNEFHALEKCYNYFSPPPIEEIDISKFFYFIFIALFFIHFLQKTSIRIRAPLHFEKKKFLFSSFIKIEVLGLYFTQLPRNTLMPGPLNFALKIFLNGWGRGYIFLNFSRFKHSEFSRPQTMQLQ